VNDQTAVSVIIPFLNAEAFIEEAVRSVFAQSYGRWELLLVDDGSTDGSREIARRSAEQHPERVQYLEHEGHRNRGTSASRNLGISRASGQYIAFLDSDDVWSTNKLEQQVAILDSEPEAAMVYGPSEFWYSWTGQPQDLQRDFVPQLGFQANTLVKPPELLKLFLGNRTPVPLPSSIMARREMIGRVGGFEETFHGMYQLYEDSAFSAKACLNESVFVADECWVRYRQHPDSCGAIWTGKGELHPERPHSAQSFFLSWLEEYFRRQNLQDAETWQVLRNVLWPYRHPILYRLSSGRRQLAREASRHVRAGQMILGRFQRSALRRAIGSIAANPNPIVTVDRLAVGTTTLSWESYRTAAVEIRIGAPDGPLLASGGPSGSASTGHWVCDGMVFHLQNVSDERPLTSANTLATVTVGVSTPMADQFGLASLISKAVVWRQGADAR
jgi:glycosyltransferase involved in cell wall biosynthesis